VRDFPPEFLWGSSTAAHQVEGGNVANDWWEWESSPGTLAAEPSGLAIDQYHRYDDDFALLASLGQNAHRFSLEWSRIEPEAGEFSEPALEHYANVLKSLHSHGLTPVVTLHHKTLPLWFARRGGWLAPDALELFGSYVTTVAKRLGAQMPYICTINEPQIIAVFGHLTAQFPPALRDATAADAVNRVLMQAHRVAVAALREHAPAASAGTCLQLVPLSPLRPDDPSDVAATSLLRRLMVDDHLAELRSGGDVGDWVGLQYYTRAAVDARLPGLIAPAADHTESTQMGWEIYPEGFGQMLRAAASTGLPVLVTENGIATTDDGQRLRYLRSHLREVRAAMQDGVDVLGYLHWSAFDNFEWNHGFTPTFGLIGIDRENGLRRIVRPSAVSYGCLARTGRLSALDAEPVDLDETGATGYLDAETA
jgi:beta-glucosidase